MNLRPTIGMRVRVERIRCVVSHDEDWPPRRFIEYGSGLVDHFGPTGMIYIKTENGWLLAYPDEVDTDFRSSKPLHILTNDYHSPANISQNPEAQIDYPTDSLDQGGPIHGGCVRTKPEHHLIGSQAGAGPARDEQSPPPPP